LISGLVTALLTLSVNASAREVFRTQDDDGVVSFSDVASPGAEVIVVTSPTVPENSIERQQGIIEQQLAVAKALEESRLAREESRTRRLEALAATRPQVIQAPPVRRTYVGGVGYWQTYPWHGPWKPGHPGWRPPYPSLPIEPPPDGHTGGGRLDPPSRAVPLPPLQPR
jgi:hypothetical protein